MKKILSLSSILLLASGVFFSCQDSQDNSNQLVSDNVRSQLVGLGFDVVKFPPVNFQNGYLVEGDIYLTSSDLATMKPATRVPVAEQYSTNQLVTSLPRTVTVYMPTTYS